jgi:hypothetical protein
MGVLVCSPEAPGLHTLPVWTKGPAGWAWERAHFSAMVPACGEASGEAGRLRLDSRGLMRHK